MSKIHIVNWLLTRKCNLDCDYCAIVKNYRNKPEEYPDMAHYYKNEMSTNYVKSVLMKFKQHNPEAFHIFYGGEPLLRKGLSEIINYCNDFNIYYTIISNNTPQIQPLIEKLFRETEYIQGFTSSVDPVISSNLKGDRFKKSVEGFNQLIEIKRQGLVKDVVAEITVMKNNLNNLVDLITVLSDNGINSDITFIDTAKSSYYDFSNITDKNLLVTKEEAKPVIDKLLNSSLNIHMKEKLLPMIYESLPSDMDCGIQKRLHNVAIDADGSVRLCLRIRGVYTPNHIYAHKLFAKDDITKVSPFAEVAIAKDKKDYCKLCNHTCYLMSQIIDDKQSQSFDLVHKNIRGGIIDGS